MHPAAFLIAVLLLAVVVAVAYCRRPVVEPAAVTPTQAPVITIIPASPTATPRDIFTVPPTPHPEVIFERTALPTATATPTVAPTRTPEPTPRPERSPIQRGMKDGRPTDFS